MKKAALGCLAGLLTWAIVVTLINFVLRAAIPGYREAEHSLDFTLLMKWSRLAMAIITSVCAGAVTRRVSPDSKWAPVSVGAIVFAGFLPAHIAIWNRFPVWYHLSFLIPIVPAVLIGSVLSKRTLGERHPVRLPAIG